MPLSPCFNRTLKERMWRYFMHKNSRRYIDVLQLLYALTIMRLVHENATSSSKERKSMYRL